MTGNGHVGHAFISYAPADAAAALHLQEALEASGTAVWRDVSVLPGDDWRATIRDAISKDALAFVACFSRNSLSAGASRQNEEINLALEQMRLRRPGVPWLIPVRFDDCVIPDLDIGAGRTLTSIRPADLFGAAVDDQTKRLVAAIQRILGDMGGQTTAAGAPSAGDREEDNPAPDAKHAEDSAAAQAGVKRSAVPDVPGQQRESAGRLTDVQLVAVGVLTMVAAFLALRWSFFRIISIVTLILAGSAAWHFSRRLGRSWSDRSVLFSASACLVACLVLAATYLPGGLGAGHPVSYGLKTPSGSASAPVVSLLRLTPRRLSGDTLSAGRPPGRVDGHSYRESLYVIFPGASFLRLLALERCESHVIDEVYPVKDQGYRGFRALAGVTDTSSKGAVVRFSVKVDGKFEGLAPLLSTGDPLAALNVRLPANVRQITLQTSEHTCFPAGSLTALWIRPELTRPNRQR